MSYPFDRNTARGATDADTAIRLFTKLIARCAETWGTRGWALTADGDGFGIAGDKGQFYLDAVANDAEAPLVMAFLARFAPDEYADFRADAADDLIDLDESQEVFLRGRALEEILEAGA